VAPVLAQMHNDALASCKFRKRCSSNRIRFSSLPRLPHGRNMVNIY
jgi:hypothetical protein